MYIKICRFLVCLVLGLVSSATGLSAAQEGGQTFVLIGARLIDGTGQAPQENVALVIQEEKLNAVGPADSQDEAGNLSSCHR